MTETEQLADVIAQTIFAELAPIVRRVESLEKAGASRSVTVFHEDNGRVARVEERLKGSAEGVSGAVLDAWVARLTTVEARVKAIESQPRGSGVHWAGVYRTGETYPEGCLVTRSGGLWLSMRPTGDVPGLGASPWKLVCKGGDAR
jgi:hypothetical protein